MEVVVLLAVGLRPKDLDHAPRIRAVADEGFAAPLHTVFPAVTCTAQATFLTGALPREHGAVANGWYFRDQAQVWFWRQANPLVQGTKVYEEARRRDPGFTCAKMFWWWNMYAEVDWSVTPRPEYFANGLKKPGLYSHPADLQRQLQVHLGPFPLFDFWGPKAGLPSSSWIARSAQTVIERHHPTLSLVYLPHLDYDHQRFGPDDPRSVAQVEALDGVCAPLIDGARERGAAVVVLSEYGIEKAHTPVFVNRILHDAGLLAVQETSHGQLLDPGASRAFAVVDHQCAHIYIRRPDDREAVRRRLEAIPGVAQVLDRDQQAPLGINHPRSGELVCIAEPGCWFAYHYWLDEARRPDFATTVDIHRKPGYDPTELFVDPKLRFPKLRLAKNLAKKFLGFRYLMDVIGTDPSLVRGTHGRLYDEPEAGPVFVCSEPDLGRGSVRATEVQGLLLDLLGR